MNLRKIVVLFLLSALCYAARAADPTRDAVQNAVNTELAADRADHSVWIFHDVDRKPNNSVVQWVAQTHKAEVNRVLSKNGQKIPLQQQRNSVEAFVHDSSAQAKQRQVGARDDQQATNMLRLLPVAFVWTLASKSAETTTYHFKPDSNFHPPTHEARVFSAMEGDMTVDNQQHRIQEIKGRLVHDVNFGWGILGKLYRGGTFRVVRTQVGHGIWDITETHVHISGHALIFKTISEQEDDEKTQWQRQPDNMTLEQAAEAVMKQPDEAR